MNTAIRCKLTVMHASLISGQKAVYEEVAPPDNRSLIQVQALMRKANVGVVTYDRKTPLMFCGVGGGLVMGRDQFSMSNLQITHIFGEPVTPDNLEGLAYRLGAPFVNIVELRKLAYQIANGSGSQLANIAQLAAITAPAMLVLEDDASPLCLDITPESFANATQARHYVQHLEVWMRSILEEHNVDDPVAQVEPWIARIANHLQVDMSASRPNQGLKFR